MYLVVRLVLYSDVDPPKKKTKMQKTSTTNSSSRSHSSYGINVGFINFLICKFLMLIARTAWKFMVWLCGCVYVCIREWQQHTHGNRRVPIKQTALKPFFFVCDQKDCVTQHTTEKKCLKFIWSLPPHINLYMYVTFFFKLTQFHLFLVFDFFFFEIKKNPFHSERSLHVGVMAKKAWQHTATSHQLHNTTVLSAYLKFLFTWIIFFLCQFMLPLFVGEPFVSY